MSKPTLAIWLCLLPFLITILHPPSALAFVPRQTIYVNTTSRATSSATISPFLSTSTSISACSQNCSWSIQPRQTCNEWVRYEVQNVTVATIVKVINNSTNTTSTITKYVESLLVNGVAPTNTPRTNVAGTVTTIVTGFNNSTTVVAYPTSYCDYEYSFPWSGVLQSTTNGRPTCVTANPTSLYALGPTHPPVPNTVVYPSDDNTPERYGLQYALVEYISDPLDLRFIFSAFAGQLASFVYKVCSSPNFIGSPVGRVGVVSYLTATATSFEEGSLQSTSSTVPPIQIASIASSPLISNRILTSSTTIQMIVPVPTAIGGMHSISMDPIESATTSKAASKGSGPNSNDESSSDTTYVTSIDSASSTLYSPVVESSTVMAKSQSQYTLGHETPTPGASTMAVSSTIILELQSNSNQLDTFADSSMPTPTTSSLTDSGGAYTTNVVSQYVATSQTPKPDDPAITVSGSIISSTTDATDTAIPSKTSSPFPSIGLPIASLFTIDSKTYTFNSASRYNIEGQTLQPGGSPITISGLPLSLGSDALVIGTSTALLSPPQTASTPPKITIDGSIYAPNSLSDYLIASQTLVPGGPAITVSGTPISLAAGASNIVLGTSTFIFSHYSTSVPPRITINGNTYVPNSASDYLITGQTLVPGGSVITISGTPISLAAGASDIIIGTTTISLSPPAPTTTPAFHLLTIDSSSIYTANSSASDYIIAGGQILSLPGGPVTISHSGTLLYSIPSIAVDATATTTPTPAVAGSAGIGGYILSGIGGGSVPSVSGSTASTTTAGALVNGTGAGAGAGIMPFTGDADRKVVRRRGMWIMSLGVVGFLFTIGEFIY